jgi:thymidylate kinase
VNDQGLAHDLGYRVRRWPEPERLDALNAVYSALGAKAAPSVIVWFDVAPALASARSKMTRPIHRDPEEVAAIVAAMEQSVLAMGLALQVRTIRVDNSSTVAATAASVLEVLPKRS